MEEEDSYEVPPHSVSFAPCESFNRNADSEMFLFNDNNLAEDSACENEFNNSDDDNDLENEEDLDIADSTDRSTFGSLNDRGLGEAFPPPPPNEPG